MHTLKKSKAPFTMVPNELLSDRSLTLKAKGLYSLMYSKPDGWTFYEDTLTAESGDGRHATRAALEELIEAGWLSRTRQRSASKQFQPYQYEMHDKSTKARPQPKSRVRKPDAAPPAEPDAETRCGKPAADNQMLINTHPSNTDVNNTKLVGAPSDDRTGYAKSLGGVLKERMGGQGPAPRNGLPLSEVLEPFGGKVPNDWIPMACLMYKLSSAAATEAAGKFVFFYTQGNGHEVRREDIGAWAEAWGTWCRGAKQREEK